MGEVEEPRRRPVVKLVDDQVADVPPPGDDAEGAAVRALEDALVEREPLRERHLPGGEHRGLPDVEGALRVDPSLEERPALAQSGVVVVIGGPPPGVPVQAAVAVVVHRHDGLRIGVVAHPRQASSQIRGERVPGLGVQRLALRQPRDRG